MIKLIIGYIIASVFWFVMFSPWTSGAINFWSVMLPATAVLTAYSLILGRKELKQIYNFKSKWIIIGIISAIILYLVFFAGNEISRLLFDFTEKQVNNVYSTKEQASQIFIALALFFWIGPAEEIFWRGFAQHELSKRIGDNTAWIVNSIIYALVHIWAFNFMLFMAALICGLFWGWMFKNYKSLIPAVISHSVWDVAIFIIIPIT